MSILNGIKFQLLALLVITFSIFISYGIDIWFYNYFQNIDDSDNGLFLKEFFIDVTQLGRSSWYFAISIVGFIDDKYNLNTGGKLSLQIIPIFYLIFFENFSLTQIGNYGFFILDLGTFSIPFTFLSVLSALVRAQQKILSNMERIS